MPDTGQKLQSLSPPKHYESNVEWRIKMLDRCLMDGYFRDLIKAMFYEDVLFAFNAFFYTLDVRKKPFHNLPFCTWPYQDETILDITKAIDAGEDVLMEKSRDMGASWMILLTFVWYWLNPVGGADFLMGSRIEDYVDKRGDPRTLFEKVRYAIKRLPTWLLPRGFKMNKHDNYLRLENPQTGASITGESNNVNFGTGGRYTAILFDEFAKWENTDISAWTSAGDATPCRIPNSTPFGAAGQHYNLVTDSRTKKIRMHWTLHPEKAAGAYCSFPRSKKELNYGEEEAYKLTRSPWYDMQCRRRTPQEIAQELDIDYIGAGALVFDGEAGDRVRELLRAKIEIRLYLDPNIMRNELVQVDEPPRDLEGFLAVWRPPDPKTTYTMGVDVIEASEGSEDWAVVKIYNRRTKSVDASYYARIDEVRLSNVIALFSAYYTTFEEPWIGIETNGPGLSTFDFCNQAHSLTRLFMTPRFDNARQQVVHKKGWRTDQVTRDRLISGIKSWLIQGQGWCDLRCCREMTTFVKGKRKPEAKSGANDDEVIAIGIAIQVDLISPDDTYAEEETYRDDGLSTKLFKHKDLEISDPRTIQDYCILTVIQKKQMQERINNDLAEIIM